MVTPGNLTIGDPKLAVHIKDTQGKLDHFENRTLTVGITWLGNISEEWKNPENWTSGVVPVATSYVFIPANRPHEPVVHANTSIRSLSLSPDSIVTVASRFTINITGL